MYEDLMSGFEQFHFSMMYLLNLLNVVNPDLFNGSYISLSVHCWEFSSNPKSNSPACNSLVILNKAQKKKKNVMASYAVTLVERREGDQKPFFAMDASGREALINIFYLMNWQPIN